MVDDNPSAVTRRTLRIKVTVNDESVNFLLDLSSDSASETKELPSGDEVYVNYYHSLASMSANVGSVVLTGRDENCRAAFDFHVEDGRCVKEVEFPQSIFAIEHLSRPPIKVKIEANLTSTRPDVS